MILTEQGFLCSPELRAKGQGEKEFSRTRHYSKFTDLMKSLNLSELWESITNSVYLQIKEKGKKDLILLFEPQNPFLLRFK